MKDKYGLTRKQRKFADKLLKTGNGTQAALEVYDTGYDVAKSIASENLTKPHIFRYIQTKCNIADITVDRVLSKLSEQMDATKTLQTSDGQVLGEKPDHIVRHKAIETCIKYVLPEFLLLHKAGGAPSPGSKHLHLHGVGLADLAGIAAGDDPEDESQ